MANKALFRSRAGRLLPRTNSANEAGGRAYAFDDEHALAQYAATGCLNATFYASAESQLEVVLDLGGRLPAEFIAKAAIYARREGLMKDLPALLCAVLAARRSPLLEEVFPRVIDSPKMLRNFVQILRSGVTGRKSLGSAPRRLVRRSLESRTVEQLFVGSVGQSPSLADVIRMVHPRPHDAMRQALYAYLIGREHDETELPEIVREYVAYKAATDRSAHRVPDVPFQLLTALNLDGRAWTEIARHASWQMTRMNLNTFLRHGVFEDRKITRLVARRLAKPDLVRRARALPYQLLTAYTSASSRVPAEIREALQCALDVSLENVPRIDGNVYVFPDISGSMHSPVTGRRKGASSAVRCVDVAALVAAAILRVNPETEVLPFEADVVRVDLNRRDSVMTNAKKLASLPAGGTNCSAPLHELNRRRARGDLVIYVSDNESWLDSPHYGHWGGGPTETMNQWTAFKRRNPTATMICIDIQPYASTQAKERDDIFNVGGFSDQVFKLIGTVAGGHAEPGFWAKRIQETQLFERTGTE